MSTKRKYFSHNSAGEASTSGNRTFLLKWLDDSEGAPTTKIIGPFSKEDDAKDVLEKYLKDGICSWLVSYND
tara:strand:- start:9814 stop:10029 length:216 start_codon:yes stop_codon:yes gene_type:complete